MVATSTLLDLTLLKRNPSYSYMQRRYNHRSAFHYYKSQYKANHLQISCKYNKQPTCLDSYARSDLDYDHVWKNSFKQIMIPNCALARSGGRIGGSAFSSHKSSSFPFSSCPSSSRSSSMDSVKPGCVMVEKKLEEEDLRFIIVYASFYLIAMSVIYAFSLVYKFFSYWSQKDILTYTTDTEKTSILRLQVGFLGSTKTLQQDFNSLAETADTSTPKGLSHVLTETCLVLLRHPDYCISCYSSVDVKQNIKECENIFNQLSVEERGNLSEETLVNVDNIVKRRSSKIQRASDVHNEYIVVTILVAVKGMYKMRPIHKLVELKKVLQKLGSIPRKQIMALEVLWTPQDEKEAMSDRELLQVYPLLSPII